MTPIYAVRFVCCGASFSSVGASAPLGVSTTFVCCGASFISGGTLVPLRGLSPDRTEVRP